LKEFKDAIEADYFFEMFIDDLPMWGYLGEV
jgi:transmembrane 9 superfamily protein 3